MNNSWDRTFILGIGAVVLILTIVKLAETFGAWCGIGVLIAIFISVVMLLCCIADRDGASDTPRRPLTLEELHDIMDEQMNESEVLGIALYIEPRNKSHLLVSILDRSPGRKIVGVWSDSQENAFFESDYGKTWRAWLTVLTPEERMQYEWDDA